MDIEGLGSELNQLLDFIDENVGAVTAASVEAQVEIYKAIEDAIDDFETKNKRFVRSQNYKARILLLEKKIRKVLGDVFHPSVVEYLGSYATIEDTTVALHKKYSQLQVEVGKLTPARKVVYSQAEHFLTKGLDDAYIQPVKYLLMQQVTTGIGIEDSRQILAKWDKGELTNGKLASGRQTPNLQKYATQIARDSAYQYHGTIQEIIQTEYDLDAGIYTGDIIEDSRPLCIHLVKLERPIKLEELPALLKKYPQGVIEGTNKKNFAVYRGGRNCRHGWFPIRSEE